MHQMKETKDMDNPTVLTEDPMPEVTVYKSEFHMFERQEVRRNQSLIRDSVSFRLKLPAPCQMSGDACTQRTVECVENFIDSVLCNAVNLIKSDPRGFFVYKNPLNVKQELTEENNTTHKSESVSSATMTHIWPTIMHFKYDTAVSYIRNYIGNWHLSPATKCVVLSSHIVENIAGKGKRYSAEGHFSRPTPKCPNPLAVARVRFVITVSNVMPKHYPIMITYFFENHKMLFYALGEHEKKALIFQRYYIDAILHAKLSFYAAICECRHGPVDRPDEAKEKRRMRKQLQLREEALKSYASQKDAE